MSTRVEITKAFIHTLANSSPRRRNLLLRNATRAELNGLFELCLNLLRGTFNLNPTTLSEFRKNRKTIEALSNRSVPRKHKKKIINQNGGFIEKLAVFALPLLTNIIANQKNKRMKR